MSSFFENWIGLSDINKLPIDVLIEKIEKSEIIEYNSLYLHKLSYCRSDIISTIEQIEDMLSSNIDYYTEYIKFEYPFEEELDIKVIGFDKWLTFEGKILTDKKRAILEFLKVYRSLASIEYRLSQSNNARFSYNRRVLERYTKHLDKIVETIALYCK